MREQVELLEDHPDPAADEVELPAGSPSPGDPLLVPSRKILPSSGGSSRLMQRSSVHLPEPLGPITQTTSPALDVEVDAAQDLELAEALVDALEREHRAV